VLKDDGETQDLFKWECRIPGKAGVSFLASVFSDILDALGIRSVQFVYGIQ